MNKNITGQMREMLEQSAECEFQKAPDGEGWTCYIGQELVSEDRTLGKCVWQAATALGEEART